MLEVADMGCAAEYMAYSLQTDGSRFLTRVEVVTEPSKKGLNLNCKTRASS